jgi:hypothetical protein
MGMSEESKHASRREGLYHRMRVCSKTTGGMMFPPFQTQEQ